MPNSVLKLAVQGHNIGFKIFMEKYVFIKIQTSNLGLELLTLYFN